MRPEKLREFSRSLLVAAGSDPEEAAVVAKVLVWCNSIGRPNQGVWRLPVLCDRLNRGLLESPCRMKMDMHGRSLGSADGGAGQGHYVAYKAMQHTMDTARTEGIAALVVRNSNFFGAGGYYAAMAAQVGLVGIALSNSFPKVRAFNGSDAVLGTNPLAFACPARDDEPLVVDMATSALAGSTVRKQEEDANPGTKPRRTAVLDPLGGSEGGSKGYGLALLVEVLSGVLSGGGFSHQVKSMYENFHESGNNGHFFLAIDIEKIMPLSAFRERVLTLLGWLEESGEAKQVKYPGQNRWEARRQSEASGIQLDTSTENALQSLAEKYGLPGFSEFQ